nr:autotransporter beta-domain protein [uncultured bacterium]
MVLAAATAPARAQGITINAQTQICGATGPGITVNAAIGAHLIVHHTQTGCSAVSTAPFSTIGTFVATVLGADIVYSTVITTAGTITVTFTGGKTLTVVVSGSASGSTTDRGVKAQVSAQAGATLRAAETQLSAIGTRIQDLHRSFETPPDDDEAAANLAQQPAPQQNAFGGMQFLTSERRTTADADPLMFEGSGLSSFRKVLHDRGATYWIGGLFDQGSFGNNGTGYDFRSAAVTAGLDGKLTERVIAGVTFGYARDFTDYDDFGSETNSRSVTVSAYGTWKATDTAFVDVVAGYSDVDLDSRRWDTWEKTLISGDRDGRSWFGSLALSNEWRGTSSLFAPYLQASAFSNKLDSYSEDAALNAIAYDGMSFTNVAFSAGFYTSYDFTVGRGILRPFAKADFTHNSDSSATQGLHYSNADPSTRSVIDIDTISQSVATGDLGLSYIDASGTQTSVWGRASAGSNDFSTQSLGVSIRAKF